MPVQRITASNNFYKQSLKKNPDFSANPAQTANAVKTDTSQNKTAAKTPYIAAGVAVAALAGAFVFRNQLGFGKAAKTVKSHIKLNDPVRLQKIKDIKERCSQEFTRILNDNTIFGEIKLDKMDEAAAFRALDKARPDYLHEAANMAEEAYKAAYQKAAPQEGKNILDRIFFRIENESRTLPKIYAQMPREDALERINAFTKSAYALDPNPGMQPQTVFNKIVEFMDMCV